MHTDDEESSNQSILFRNDQHSSQGDVGLRIPHARARGHAGRDVQVDAEVLAVRAGRPATLSRNSFFH